MSLSTLFWSINFSIVINSFEKNSDYMKAWVYRVLKERKLLNNVNKSISILGIAYKENTNSTKNSPSLKLIKS